MTLAEILIDLGAPGKGAPAPLRWLSDWLPDADRVMLDRADMARLEAYRGSGEDLHALLSSVLPLVRPVWWEATVTAAGGTEITMGYGAVPVGDDAMDVGWASYAPEYGRVLGPLGPARVSAAGIAHPAGMSDESWRALDGAAAIVMRALLLGMAW